MRVAITGISSFLASAIVPLLEKDDEITEILGLDIKEPSLHSKKLTFKKIDVRNPQIEQELNGFDALLHLAFIVFLNVPKSVNEIYSINVEGSRNVFNCAAKAGVKHILHASSIAAYGAFPDNPKPITEEWPIRIMKKKFYYNETKVLAEKILDDVEKAYPNLKTTRFRPPVIIGPPLENAILIAAFKGKSVHANDLDDILQYIHVDDVASAFYLALKKGISGAFNITGDGISHEEYAKALNKPLKKMRDIYRKIGLFFLLISYNLHLQRTINPGWLRIAKYPIIVDAIKAKTELGWKPKYTTLEAVLDYKNYLKEIGRII